MFAICRLKYWNNRGGKLKHHSTIDLIFVQIFKTYCASRVYIFTWTLSVKTYRFKYTIIALLLQYLQNNKVQYAKINYLYMYLNKTWINYSKGQIYLIDEYI